MRKIGIGASLGAILGLGLMAAGGHPYDTLTPYKRDRSNEPKFRLPPTPAGPITDSTPESKRAKRRRLAKAPK